MSAKDASAAIYLVGHGHFHEPRLIELQYWRIMRYIDAAGFSLVPPKIFIDLNLPRSSGGPQTLEGLPAFMQLLDGVRSKAFGFVFLDLEDGARFAMYSLTLIRPYLERAGAKVFNAFYDDGGKVTDESIRQRSDGR